jgi:hypothetical protein
LTEVVNGCFWPLVERWLLLLLLLLNHALQTALSSKEVAGV